MENSGPIARRATLDAQGKNVLAVREVGGNNRGASVEKYLASCGIEDPAPWCAAFVWYRLVQAAKAVGETIPAWLTARAYTPDWRNCAIKNKCWIPVATAQADPSLVQVGDIVLFYFESMGRIAHIGIVVGLLKNEAGTVIGVRTVEGNTGPDSGSTVERAGDGVYAKKRTFGQLGARGGFVRLAF